MEVVMSGAAASMSPDYSPPRGESPAWSTSKESDDLFSTLKFQRLMSMMPFTMPADEDLLDMRVVERASIHDIRKKERVLPVAEKETFASKLGATRWSKELKKDMEKIDAEIAGEMERLKSVTVLPVEHFHKNKENMAEFLEKKRDIFLAQMSLDTKKAEIRKIEDKIFQREEALRKSENMLTDDSQEFDAFLKQNDEKVQEAIRKAEHQARLKQDKYYR